jgi:hypothetical protein
LPAGGDEVANDRAFVACSPGDCELAWAQAPDRFADDARRLVDGRVASGEQDDADAARDSLEGLIRCVDASAAMRIGRSPLSSVASQ